LTIPKGSVSSSGGVVQTWVMASQNEGSAWRFQVLGAVAIAGFFVVIGAIGALGDHDWTAWFWGAGALIVVIPFCVRSYQMRLVEFDAHGTTIRRFFRSTRFDWSQIQSVGLKSQARSNGSEYYVPTIWLLSNSKPCPIWGLAGFHTSCSDRVATLEAARERYTPAPD
jgi:hypothetical protein